MISSFLHNSKQDSILQDFYQRSRFLDQIAVRKNVSTLNVKHLVLEKRMKQRYKYES